MGFVKTRIKKHLWRFLLPFKFAWHGKVFRGKNYVAKARESLTIVRVKVLNFTSKGSIRHRVWWICLLAPLFNFVFDVGLASNVGDLFGHPLWSIFQSVVTHNELLYTLKITLHWTCTCNNIWGGMSVGNKHWGFVAWTKLEVDSRQPNSVSNQSSLKTNLLRGHNIRYAGLFIKPSLKN